MSVPAGQMGQDPKQKQAEGDSHKAVHGALQASPAPPRRWRAPPTSRTPS
jgi:hypothetical protein